MWLETQEHGRELEWHAGRPGLGTAGGGVWGGRVPTLAGVAAKEFGETMVKQGHRRDQVVREGECLLVEAIAAQALTGERGVVGPH